MSNRLLNWDRWGLENINSEYSGRVFIAREIPGLKRNLFYPTADPFNFKPSIDIISKLNITDSINSADFVLVPHPWVSIQKNKAYVNYLHSLSKNYPLLLANTDDLQPPCAIPNTLQLRSSLHPRENNFRKIVMPYPAKHQDFKIREWKSVPQLSFVGFVPKLSLGSLTSKSLSFIHSPIKSSVYINRKLSLVKLKKLKSEFKVTCLERSQFTLLADNPNLNSHIQEYKTNLLQSDYILCPRGFGNFSIRFYEALSSGATPLVIDSGSELPQLNDNNFWNSNVILLNLFTDWAKIIRQDWKNLGEGNNYRERQLRNRSVFLSELDIQKHSEKLFAGYLLS
jgi:hypothetical protein